MIREILTVKNNKQIAEDTWKMTLQVPCQVDILAGQFVNIEIEGKYLRRPISICDFENNILTIVYKVVGEGTLDLTKKSEGDKLDVLLPLGNGYELNNIENEPTLVGGGVGVPPLFLLAKRLLEKNVRPKVVLGFGYKEQVFLEEEFKNLGIEVEVFTMDGSYGKKGVVTDSAFVKDAYVMTCGPEPMLKALWKESKDGQFSFEERMGCGFGACMGCSCKTLTGYKRICKEGPVMERGEILWT